MYMGTEVHIYRYAFCFYIMHIFGYLLCLVLGCISNSLCAFILSTYDINVCICIYTYVYSVFRTVRHMYLSTVA
jgi:hypothetical protein